MRYQLDSFDLDLKKCVAPPNYIWVSSGRSTCSPIAETVFGVKGCFSPPFAAKNTSLMVELEINGHQIKDSGNKGKDDSGLLFSGAIWSPNCIVRKGTYHYIVNNMLISIQATSELTPLATGAGFVLKVVLKNRSETKAIIKIKPIVNPESPALIPLEEWDFMPPETSSISSKNVGLNCWDNSVVRTRLIQENDSEISLANGEICEKYFLIEFSKSIDNISPLLIPSVEVAATQNKWQKKINLANEKIPYLETDNISLKKYYERSLISGLICLWDNDDFVTSPFPTTSGIDGGSLCCYPWDLAGYASETFVMLLGDKTLDFLKTMLSSGIDKHIMMALDGSGSGNVSYAYSMWSLINMYWQIITLNGSGQELFDKIVELFEFEESRLPEWNDLKDYGVQHNLLEMRTHGYEHYVPSPNAERAWSYNRLADIADFIGKDKEISKKWRFKAKSIIKSIQTNLWDENREWFKCLSDNGSVEFVYSIQDYDVLRMGACNDLMKEVLLAHLEDGKFLGSYGVSSVSAEDDKHYELNDPDWSGGGCYSGDGPNLAETLWNLDENKKAWDVIERLYWMGEMLPYFPQEHYCDKPGVPSNKRANIIAGVAGLQSIIFGLFGIKAGLNGKLEISPNAPEKGFVNIKGFKYETQHIDILLDPIKMEVIANKRTIYRGPYTTVLISRK